MFIAEDAPAEVGNGTGSEQEDRPDSIIRWEPERTAAPALVDTLLIVAALALVAVGVIMTVLV